jgi:hypothetical protein
MIRTVIVSAVFLIGLILAPVQGFSQVSQQADKRVKDAEAAQAKSWEQVDQVNKETDQTNARLQQSRKNGDTVHKQGGYSLKKKETATASPYAKKPKVQKGAPPKKKM